MAANSPYRFWPWILFAIQFCKFYLPSRTDRAPCMQSNLPNLADDLYVAEAEVIVFLREVCDGEVNATVIQDFFQSPTFDVAIAVVPSSLTCEVQTWGIDALLHVITRRKRTKALIATLDASTCEIVGRLAHIWHVPLITWTCPMRDTVEKEESSMIRLSPSLPSIARALAEIFVDLQWRTAVIIGTDREPWLALDRAVAHILRDMGVILRYRVTLPYRASLEETREILQSSHGVPRRATVLCLPTDEDEAIFHVLTELDLAWQTHHLKSTILLIHTEDDDLFLPRNDAATSSSTVFHESTSTQPPDFSTPNVSRVQPSDASYGIQEPIGEEQQKYKDEVETVSITWKKVLGTLAVQTPQFQDSTEHMAMTTPLVNDPSENIEIQDEYEEQKSHIKSTISEKEIRRQRRETEREWFPEMRSADRFLLLGNLSDRIVNSLLAIRPFDQRCNVQRIFEGTEYYAMPSLLDRINDSLHILTSDNSSINAANNKVYSYSLLEWNANNWKPILLVLEQENQLTIRKLSGNAVAFRNTNGPSDYAGCEADVTDCTDDARYLSESGVRIVSILAIAFGSLLLTLTVIVVAAFIRKRVLQKRVSKGPYKIILTTSDFVFPQTPQLDTRTVDEGIETMLCCWLQQLQEFGGPEVEKPDLLQLGSVSSLRPYLQASTGNLARHPFMKDPRARYNGDLVQLKELVCQGTFELRGKAMDVLMTIHGLRHENLNPLIGCLNEPTRPCLVYEYCSRGSLEDVLIQDEIKLDWSFRLSLLTDLVRGMRYIHGTPIRVHGYLTSRNCVIDARWVLKVTDYGLPAFYEAQNINPPAKTARDLLWTAPELLRNANLRKKGTQTGDVYSFGIIMQEVVVRGEPFCMLALSPEDIIEKVMRPPPLIRPSVSKGAAPPEAINIMRQCWAEAADMRPDFDDVHDLFKKLNHGRKVNFVDTMFQMLEKYSNNLEELIRERTEQLDMEKKKTEQLLNRMLPSSVAEKLKLGMPVDPEEFREVTIYFSDIVGFTTISAHSTPFQVVDLLNDLYTCFDATINAYTVYKVETIGDAYMVVGGCPVRIPDHASQIATMALDLLHQSGKFKLRHLPKTQLRLRIGLHTGPCCAGVVGLTMPRYCLFGDTVNTASRMESTGAPWRIHLSQATRDWLVQVGGYELEYRGCTEVKGKGKMPTYWLLGKQGFDKELPVPPPLGENHGLDESRILRDLTSEEVVETTVTVPSPEEKGDGNLNVKSNQLVGTGDAEAYRKADEQVAGGPVGDASCENTRKITVSVHEEKTRQLSAEHVDVAVVKEKMSPLAKPHLQPQPQLQPQQQAQPQPQPPSSNQGGSEDISTGNAITKSTSAETQASLGALSCMESTSPALLGASTTSLTSISSSATLSYRPAGSARHRRFGGCIDENDLSTPYNHYRCLSPNEHYARGGGARLLKRQFSLDRSDEPLSVGTLEPQQQQPLQHQYMHQHQYQQQNQRASARLYKQNSAGAANDLERIEEVPSTPSHIMQNYRHAASVSLSVESLSLR